MLFTSESLRIWLLCAVLVFPCLCLATLSDDEGDDTEPFNGFPEEDHSSADSDETVLAVPFDDPDRGTINDPSWIWESTAAAVSGADERGEITCTGYYPQAFASPIAQTRVNSLVEFCADTAYGGRLWRYGDNPTRNGAFCAWNLQAPHVVMSRERLSQTNLRGWLRWVFCQTKCRCTHTMEHHVVTDASTVIDNRLKPLSRRSSQMIWIPAANRPLSYYQANEVRHPIAIYSVPNSMLSPPLQFDYPNLRKAVVYGAKANELKCEGPRPTWLNSYGRKYKDNTKLCSAVFVGGMSRANAGGVCQDPDLNKFSFQEDFSAPMFSKPEQPSLTDPNHTFEPSESDDEPDLSDISFITQLWCRVHCACAQPKASGVENRPSATIVGVGEARWEDGEFRATFLPRAGGNGKPEVNVLLKTEPVPDQAPAADQKKRQYPCSLSEDGKSQICVQRAPRPIPWPASTSSTGGGDDVSVSTSLRLFATSSRLDMLDLRLQAPSCGATCTTNRDCGGGSGASRDPSKQCSCVVTSRRAETEVYDPVAGTRVVRYALAAACMVAKSRVVGGLGMGLGMGAGRGVGVAGGRKRRRDVDEMVCVCNATYVSASCCGLGGEGVVWEAPERQWGVLLEDEE